MYGGSQSRVSGPVAPLVGDTGTVPASVVSLKRESSIAVEGKKAAEFARDMA